MCKIDFYHFQFCFLAHCRFCSFCFRITKWLASVKFSLDYEDLHTFSFLKTYYSLMSYCPVAIFFRGVEKGPLGTSVLARPIRPHCLILLDSPLFLTQQRELPDTCFVKSYWSCSSCRSLFWTFCWSSVLCGEAGCMLLRSSELDGWADSGGRRCDGDGGLIPALSIYTTLNNNYTVSQKQRRHYTLVHIFAKYWPIFIILSRTHSVGNLQ